LAQPSEALAQPSEAFAQPSAALAAAQPAAEPAPETEAAAGEQPAPAAAKTQEPVADAPEPNAPSNKAEVEDERLAASGTSDQAADEPAEDSATLLKNAGRLLNRDPEAASRLYEKVVAQESSNPHGREGLAAALLKLNRPGDALAHAQLATRLRPKRGRYQVLLGDVLAALGRDAEAQEAYKHAVFLDPSDKTAKSRLK